MKLRLPRVKNFSEERSTEFVSALAFFASIGVALLLSYVKTPDYVKLSLDLTSGNFADVITMAEQVVSRRPNDLDAVHLLVGAYLSESTITGNPVWKNKAIALINKTLSNYPDDPETLRQQGRYYLMSNATKLALNSYQKALSLDNNDSRSWSELANLYQNIGEFSLSRSLVVNALRINPADSVARVAEIRQNFFDKKTDLAVTQSLNLVGTSHDILAKASVYEMLGLDALMNNNFDEADKYFSQSIGINPQMLLSLTGKASALVGKYFNVSPSRRASVLAEASDLANKAIAIKPDYSLAYLVLQKVAILNNDSHQAEILKAQIMKSLKTDTLTPITIKEKINNSLTIKPVTNFKVISIKQITPDSISATSTRVIILKNK